VPTTPKTEDVRRLSALLKMDEDEVRAALAAGLLTPDGVWVLDDLAGRDDDYSDVLPAPPAREPP
jgi:hypothetical protein